MALDIGDPVFSRWLADQPDDIKLDFAVYWGKEVIRHPFIRAHPDTASALRRSMILTYAQEVHEYDPRRVDELASA